MPIVADDLQRRIRSKLARGQWPVDPVRRAASRGQQCRHLGTRGADRGPVARIPGESVVWHRCRPGSYGLKYQIHGNPGVGRRGDRSALSSIFGSNALRSFSCLTPRPGIGVVGLAPRRPRLSEYATLTDPHQRDVPWRSSIRRWAIAAATARPRSCEDGTDEAHGAAGRSSGGHLLPVVRRGVGRRRIRILGRCGRNVASGSRRMDPIA